MEDELPEGGVGLHTLRLALLDALIQRIPSLASVGGVTTIPFFQVMLLSLCTLVLKLMISDP